MSHDLRSLYCDHLQLCESTEVDLDWALDNQDADKLHVMCRYYLEEREVDRADYLLLLCVLLSFEELLEARAAMPEDERLVVEVVNLALTHRIDAYYLCKLVPSVEPAADDAFGTWFMTRFPKWQVPASPWQ